MQIGGSYFELYKCSFDLAKVALEFEYGSSGDLLEDVREGIYVENKKYTGFAITNGATAQTITIMIGANSGGNRAAPLTGSVAITNTVPVTGPLTDAQLRASAVLTRPQRVQDAAGGLSYLLQGLYGSNLAANGVLLCRLSMPVAATRRARIKTVSVAVPPEVAAGPNAIVSLYKVKGYTAAPAGQAMPVAAAGQAASFSQALVSSQHGVADDGWNAVEGYTAAVAHELVVRSVARAGGVPAELIIDAEAMGIGLGPAEALVVWMRNDGGSATTKRPAVDIAWAEE
ncbi:hypothetical protein [Aquabacterium sp.]|uniref:hypothetical protein n=1 Tax=Aquabacterium sp. TaxID=1872578 RepID=UPI003BB0CA74